MKKHDTCPAMRKAGITDPESQEGKDFCTQRCPYPDCVVASDRIIGKLKRAAERRKVRKLHKNGMPRENIAKLIGKHVRTVDRYLSNV